MSKGDTYRKVDYKKWSDNYERIFGVKDQKEVNNKESGKGVLAHEEVVQDQVVKGIAEQEPSAAD